MAHTDYAQFSLNQNLVQLAEKLSADELARRAFREDPGFFLQAHGIHTKGVDLNNLYGILGRRGV